MDQALTLKRMIANQERGFKSSPLRVISVTSGKGGVGKTNVVANLAFALTLLNRRVLVFDADVALGNIDVMLGLTPIFNLHHVINGELKLSDILMTGPGGMMILPASSGIQELTELSISQKITLLNEMDMLDYSFDIMLIDTAAGISNNVMYFNTAAQDIIIVVSPEPTSITDAYALMKILNLKYGEREFKLLVNMVRDEMEAREVYCRLSKAADKFLNISIDYIGYIINDPTVNKSIMQQRPVVEVFPASEAARCFISIAKSICEWPANTYVKGNIQFLWKRLMSQSDWNKI